MTNATNGGSTVPRRQLGRELRKYRDLAEITQAEAARRMEWSPAKMFRLENGKIPVRTLDVGLLCDIYSVRPETKDALQGLAAETKSRGWWHSFGDLIPAGFDVYIGLEHAASELRVYQSELVPGLMQTEAYAEEVVRVDGSTAEEDVHRRVRLRLNRQKLLTRRVPPCPTVDVVLNEAILRRPIGGAAVMAEQLDRINELGALPHVSVRVAPFHAGTTRGVLSGPFVLLRFPEDTEPPTVYVDGYTGDLYLDKVHEYQRYEGAFHSIQKHSLDASTSRDLIDQVAKELHHG